MNISNYDDILTTLNEVRGDFHKVTSEFKYILEEPISLYFDLNKLIGFVAEEGDDEINIGQVCLTAFRRVISSFVLLESGFSFEASIVLRNAIELILIGIDITYKKDSLKQWIETLDDNLEENGDELEFARKIYYRVMNDKTNQIYPQDVRESVILEKTDKGNGIFEEWKRISNVSLHAHSKAQIIPLFYKKGEFLLFTKKNPNDYKTDFYQLRNYIMNIISILRFIPKYVERLHEREVFFEQTKDIVNRFMNIQDKMKKEYQYVI
ncbi:MAG: hypothetical protein M1419_08605 [Bacteroidetes bacterium]|nr:hypothetical protein [Bacteroidota bacterium]